MRSLSDKYLDDIVLKIAKKHGVSHIELRSMINSVFKLFLRKMTNMYNVEIINMPSLGRFYMGQVAKRNKSRWLYINEQLEKKLKENNISYDFK